MNQQSLDSLEWFSLLEHYSAHCASAPARRMAKEILPAETQSEAEERQKLTQEAIILREKNSFHFLSGIPEMDAALMRMQKEAVLDGKELRYLVKLNQITSETHALLRNSNLFIRWNDQLVDLENIVKPIEHMIDDMGRVVDSATQNLFRLRSEEKRLHLEARDRLEAILQHAFRSGYLQDKYFDFRDGRYLIPVKSEYRNKVPGLVVENSSSNATVFIEPASVRNCNDQLKQVLLEIEEEIYKILFELSQTVFPHTHVFLQNFHTLIHVDLCLARASFAEYYSRIRGASRPEFSDTFDLDGLYHPLLSFVIPADKIIRNNFRLTEKKVLIISGPNTGGKTVLLKTLGLFSLMARSGFYLSCAGEAKIPFFCDVLSQIGDSQNLELSLSSFSGSVLQLKEILESTKGSVLVLIDEILHATDPDEATALGRSILEELKANGSYAIVTTHLNGLKVAGSEEFENASMEFDPELMSPTYRLRMGVPGSSRALEIAQKLGIPSHIISRAKNYLSKEKVKAQETLDQLESKERALQISHNELQERKTSLEKEISRLQKQNLELEKIKFRFRSEALEKIRSQQADATQSLSEIMQKYKERLANIEEKHLGALETQADIAKVKELFQKAEEYVEKIVPPPKPEIQPKATTFIKNESVYIRTMRCEGVLLSDPQEKQKPAEVLIGNMRMKLPWEKIEPRSTPKPAHTSAPHSNLNTYSKQNSSTQNISAELNLIGKTSEEARDEMEAYLDRASLSDRSQVRIIHGHGNGILRKTVRDFLAKCGYEMKFRPGTKDEGGDGCTVVEFI